MTPVVAVKARAAEALEILFLSEEKTNKQTNISLTSCIITKELELNQSISERRRGEGGGVMDVLDRYETVTSERIKPASF